MNILDKLKQIDQSKITDTGLIEKINTALGFYDDRDQLKADEIATYEKLYTKAEAHIAGNAAAEKKKTDDTATAADADKKANEKKQKAEAIRTTVFPHQQFLKDNNLQLKDTTRALVNQGKGVHMAIQKWVKDPEKEENKTRAHNASNNLLKQLREFVNNKKQKMTADEKAAADTAAAAKAKADEDAAAAAALSEKEKNENAAAAEAANKKTDADAAAAVVAEKKKNNNYIDDLMDF